MLGIREVPGSWKRHECPLVPRNVALVRMPLTGWCVMHERRRKVEVLADGYNYCPWCGASLNADPTADVRGSECATHTLR